MRNLSCQLNQFHMFGILKNFGEEKGFLLLSFLLALPLAACNKAEQIDQPSPPCLDAALANESVLIKGGQFEFGEMRYYPEEGPVEQIEVASFEIDATEVTNAQFEKFVSATGYVTEAEKGLSAEVYPQVPEEFRSPGSAVFLSPDQVSDGNADGWWQFVAGATWKSPTGPGSSIEGREHYPVMHVTYLDARTYANWLGRRLPTEQEWEYAARGGFAGAKYAWGDESPHIGESKANTWQGNFPHKNDGDDGFLGVAPVGCYNPNNYGLYDMTGNLWEWTETAYLADRQMDYRSEGYDPRQPGVTLKSIKGGSFLCSDNYCQRYRPAARQGQDITLATSHIGFRTAADADELPL